MRKIRCFATIRVVLALVVVASFSLFQQTATAQDNPEDICPDEPPPLWQLIRFSDNSRGPRFFWPMVAPALGDAAWGDFNADGKLDLVITGNTSSMDKPDPWTAVFRLRSTEINPFEGEDAETEFIARFEHFVIQPEESHVWRSMVAWTDYNNDGYLDFIQAGIGGSGNRQISLHRYLNEGWGARRFEKDHSFSGLSDGDIAVADYDNDGDLDFAISGVDDQGVAKTVLYENHNAGTSFSLHDPGFVGLKYSSMTWGDYDNDQDMDLLVTGVSQNPQSFRTILYRNDGNGVFSDVRAGLESLYGASVAWGDYDADGDLDILLSGGVLSPFLIDGMLYVYENVFGSFSKETVKIAGFWDADRIYGRYRGSAGWGDYDSDGDLDFFVAGVHPHNDLAAGQMFENVRGDVDAEGKDFRKLPTCKFTGRGRFGGGPNGVTSLQQITGRGRLGLFVLGEDPEKGYQLFGLRFHLFPWNSDPKPPTNLGAVVDGGTVRLSWSPGSDEETPAAGLTYNVRIGTSPGDQDVMPAFWKKVIYFVGQEQNYRLLPAHGNAQQNLGWTVRNLDPGTYHWSVQSIDTSFTGSPFADELSFTISE